MLPEGVRPYVFHGLDLSIKGAEALGDCPFCGRPKFSVRVENGLAQCWGCPTLSEVTQNGGINPLSFVRLLYQAGKPIRKGIRGISRRILEEWGVREHPLKEGEWMLPGYGPHGRIDQLYVYRDHNERKIWKATPTLHAGLFTSSPKRISQTVFLCEGLWDGCYFQQHLGERASTIIAAPGATVFPDSWASRFRGRNVYILFDNDKAGQLGARKIARTLHGIARVKYLQWPEGTEEGFDVYDWLRGENEVSDLIQMCVDPPDQWYEDSPVIQLAQCTNYRALSTAWKKSGLKWVDGLDHALSVMLAVILSTKAQGDQLWVRVISPASSGKSTLCEAISTNLRYVAPKSIFRGFHSGYRSIDGDSSLVPFLDGKTLVVKDGDTLLQQPNLNQILSEARDLYDRTSRTHYRNRVCHDYSGISMTWILCGTGSLRSLDDSELGERFLDCVIFDEIDNDLEEQILWRKVNIAAKDTVHESNGKMETYYSPELLRAMQLTGGYVGYLRENAFKLLPSIQFPEHARKYCVDLARMVSFMRAKPSQRQKEVAERELAARLVGQFAKLGCCLAVVLNKSSVDTEVLMRMKRVALDTSRGRNFDIAMALHEAGALTLQSLAARCGQEESELTSLLRFLKKIKAVQTFKNDKRVYWQLADHLSGVFVRVLSQGECYEANAAKGHNV